MSAFVRKGDLWLPKEDGVRVYRQVPKPGYGRVLPFRAMNIAAFDTRFEKGSVTQSSPFSFVSNAGTVTGTVGGTNRVLIGVVGFFGTASATSAVAMTWNAVTMTQIAHVVDFPNNIDLYLFGLINPATGNQTLSCSWTGGTGSVALGAVNVKDADQTTGWNNGSTDVGTGTSASSAVTTTNGSFAVVGHQNDDANTTTLSVGTSAWIETTLNGNYAQAYSPATTTTTTITWTLGQSKRWGNVKVNVLAFVATAFVPLVGGPGGHAGMPLAGTGGGLAG